DNDGYWNGTAMVPGAPALPGVAEAVTSDNTVVLGLHVTPRAGDVRVTGNVTTPEDTPVVFLAGLQVTDTGTANGSEVITEVAFDVPVGWAVTAPAPGVNGVPALGWSTAGDGTTGTYTITFTD